MKIKYKNMSKNSLNMFVKKNKFQKEYFIRIKMKEQIIKIKIKLKTKIKIIIKNLNKLK